MIFCSKPQKFTWRNAITLLLLLTAGSILILLLIPSGSWFGSETDWYSQHVTIADYMRKNFYATGSLFPDFTGLGGGTNFFSLSYYGFMRPDVLISYLFPHVEMEWFIQGYAIFEILLGGGLLYYWLHRKGFSDFTSFACGFFYLSANCFFQAHRQIMFVNYLPFLLLAFLCLDRIFEHQEQDVYHIRPHIGLILSLFFCILHSFYFFPSSFLACILYISHLLPAMVLPTTVAVLLAVFVHPATYWQLIPPGLLFVAVYAASMWLFGMNRYERGLVTGPLRRILHRQ